MSWHCVKEDKSMGEENRRKVYQLDDAADVASVPEDEDSALGSLAYLADMTAFWLKGSDGTWAESTSDALALIGLIG